MRRLRRQEKNGPGLLFILVTLVVVAVVAARFFGFYPGAEDSRESPPAPPQVEQGEDIQEPAPVDPTPKVLVYHSHATENYSPKDSHERGGDPGDVVAVGELFVSELEARGVRAIHDRTVFDKPRYSEAFIRSEEMVERVLGENDQVQMVLDLHRDGLQEKPEGYTTVELDGREVAQVLFVVGDKDNSRVEENVAFAERISEALEQTYPGVSRGVRVFQSDYSQELHPNSVMVVIGDWRGNTIEQANESAKLLAEVVATLVE